MVRIRLRRTGLKNQPTYRIVVADKESPNDGRFLEIVGSYNPRTNPTTVELDEGRVYEWLKKGAQPSLPTLKVFNSIGLMDRYARFKAGENLETLLAEAKTPRAEKEAVRKPSKKVAKAEKTTASKPTEAEKPVDAEKPAEEKPTEAEKSVDENKE